jgi:hypothetical protein
MSELKPCPVEALTAISTGKLAKQLCANCPNRAPSHEAELRELLSHAMEVIAPPPERNCSCHISPPCSDCVEWSGLREWFERANAILAKLDASEKEGVEE